VSDEGGEIRRDGQSSVKIGQNAKGDKTIEVKVYRPPADPDKGSTFAELAQMAKDADAVVVGFNTGTL
jgi:hypothetical protein